MADNSNNDNPLIRRLSREAKLRANATEAEVQAFIEVLRRFLQRNLVPIIEGLRGDSVTAREAAKALGGLETALKEAGLSDRFDSLKEMFSSEFEAVAEEFKDTTGKAALLSGFAKKNVESLIDTRLALAATFIADYVGDVRNAVLDTIVGGKKVNPRDIVENAEGRKLANLETEINTTLMAYQRVLHFEKAKKAGVDKFLYIGPDDEITREFCKDHVGGIYTREEIDAMDNGQGLPVSIYGGGYNCRHHWRPVSDDLAEEITGSK